jgi:hypothetical protein
VLGLPQQEVGHVRAGGFADFQAWGQRGQHLVGARKWAIRKRPAARFPPAAYWPPTKAYFNLTSTAVLFLNTRCSMILPLCTTFNSSLSLSRWMLISKAVLNALILLMFK